jgi:ABC-type transport system substrate-binding protein
MKMVKNPDYWDKGLPYLDGIQIDAVSEGMSQMLLFKTGSTHAIYDAMHTIAAQLRDEGHRFLFAPGSLYSLSFDVKNNKILADKRVRLAMEHAIDKDAICSGPGLNIYKPVYQVVPETSYAYNKACPPRKYNPARARQLLAEAGYPKGFSFKIFLQDSTWRDGLTAVQAYLADVGINMDINFVSTAVINTIIKGKIEPGAVCQMGTAVFSNALFPINYFWRSNAFEYPFVVKPNGIDALIDKARSARDNASMVKATRDVVKLLYDDETVVPLWVTPRIAVVDKSVQNPGYFINGDQLNNKFGRTTWFKK